VLQEQGLVLVVLQGQGHVLVVLQGQGLVLVGCNQALLSAYVRA
jgi:hypothetical protein